MRLAWLLPLFLCACKEHIPLEAKVIRMNEDGIVFDVTTRPDFEVSFDMSQGTRADALGHARLVVPLSHFGSQRSTNQGNVWTSGERFLTSYWGHAVVTFPYSIEQASKISAHPTGAWLVLTAAKPECRGELRDCKLVHVRSEFGDWSQWFVGGVGELHLAGPAGATVHLGAHQLTLDAAGEATDSWKLNELLAFTRLFPTPGHALYAWIPVVLEAPGQPVRRGELSAEWQDNHFFGDLMKDLAAGQPIAAPADAQRATRLVAYREPEYGVELHGGLATLGQVDVVAVGTPSERAAPACTGYREGILGNGRYAPDVPRVYVDLDVIAFDARSGARVSSRRFNGGTVGCPKTVGSLLTVRDGFSRAEVSAWLDELTRQ